jgi:hypothetical protein
MLVETLDTVTATGRRRCVNGSPRCDDCNADLRRRTRSTPAHSRVRLISNTASRLVRSSRLGSSARPGDSGCPPFRPRAPCGVPDGRDPVPPAAVIGTLFVPVTDPSRPTARARAREHLRSLPRAQTRAFADAKPAVNPEDRPMLAASSSGAEPSSRHVEGDGMALDSRPTHRRPQHRVRGLAPVRITTFGFARPTPPLHASHDKESH